MAQDKDRVVELLDDVCHRKRLAGACDTDQRLESVALFDAGNQLGDGLRLVP
jgi:hypothetical protein